MGKGEILQDYLDFKRTSVTSKAKLKDIKNYTKMFLDSFKVSVDKAGEKELVSFLNKISKDYSVNSMNGIKAGLKNFIKWYYVDWSSKFRNLDRLCRTQKPPKTYQPEQMLKIEDVEKLVEGEKDLLWKSYWLVYFYGGFRPSEACRLEWHQIEFEDDGAIIKLKTTKTGKEFYKALPKNVEHYLKEWKKFNSSKWVFPSPLNEGKHIHVKSVWHRLKNLSQRVLGKHISPYILRHSIATIKYNDDNLKSDDVANHMGHSKNMKEVYLNLDEDSIKTRARKLWIAPKKLTPKERDELKRLRKNMDNMKKRLLVQGEITKYTLQLQMGLITQEELLEKAQQIEKVSKELGLIEIPKK